MKEWKDIRIDGIVEIERVVAVFEVWFANNIPYGGKFKIKILENIKGKYTGVPNIRIKNHQDGTVDGISGFGSSVADALEDTLKYFMNLLNVYVKLYGRELTEEDFEWAAPEDFS